MSIVRVISDKKVYTKYHSFETFHSNINSDIEFQRRRAIKIIEDNLPLVVDSHSWEILSEALKDLSSRVSSTADFKMTTYISDEMSRLKDDDICQYIIHRYRYDVYPKKKILDGYPPYLQIEPTSLCNYRCVFCYQTDMSFTDKSRGFMGSMTLELFKKVIDQIVDKIEFLSLASRGEPFICKDIDKMFEYCVGKFLGLKINTNASLLTEQHCHAILSGGVSTIVFSVDAAEEPLYSQLRVNGKLERVLRNIEMFHTIKNKHYSKSKIITRVSGVKVNDKQEISSMVALWRRFVDQVAFVRYNPWENVYESSVNDLTMPCSDLWRRMFIWYDGLVNPCDTDYKSTLSVGHIQKKSISELWCSEAYEKLRENHLKQRRLQQEPCRRCVVV